ncbi:pectate lyase [Metabacillus malikii]|uniref:PelA/Pel-15E family pectate lyase n=1 Tax=Metabacillus malikii TaxID=1504265 RepID=A0ABT9ZIA9_9BACI|nr:pectate lyase [Metabacillus malikii]MDQ0232013.1 PelA/Pel-15E family pectate lyase [Metabacillus malikii]
MKKLVNAFLCLILLFPALQAVAGVAQPEQQVAVNYLVNDDFENEKIGELPDGYTHSASEEGVTEETSAVYVSEIPNDSEGNSSKNGLRIFDNDSASSKRARTIVTKSFDRQEGSVVVELDIMEPKVVGNSYPLRIEDKQNGKTAVILEVSGRNLGYRGSDGTFKSFNEQGVPLEGNVWTHIKLLVDTLGDSAEVYVNENYIGNIPFYENVDQIDSLEAQTAGTSVGDIYWDNVQVYVEPTDSPKALTATFGNQTVELNWKAAKGAASYTVKRSSSDGGPYETIASNITETRYVDKQLQNDTTYYYVVTAVNAVGESQPSNQIAVTPTEIPNPPSTPTGLTASARNSQVDLKWDKFGESKKILFVGTGIPADEKTIKHLEAQGFTVTFIKDNDVKSDDVNGYDLVFVGESSGSGYIGKKFMNSQVPVVYAEPFALDDVQLSSANSGTFGSYENQTAINIKTSSHPLAAGLNGKITVYTKPGSVNFGKPSEEAIIIATAAGDEEKATIFAYEKGSKNVNGDPVPARQVSTFLFAGQEDFVTAEGWKLIDESVKWALGLEKENTTSKVTYNIKRASTKGGPYELIASQIEDTQYRDTGLDNNQNYYYVISAVNIGGESNNSKEVAITPSAPLPSPTSSLKESHSNKITITWNAVNDATSYEIKRSTKKGISYETIKSDLKDTIFTDTSVTNGQEYYYVISAKNDKTKSAHSNPVRAIASNNTDVPELPTNIEAKAGDSQATLTWSAVGGAKSYNIKRALYKSNEYQVIAENHSLTSYQDVGLVNGETYDYIITAINENGESVHSEPVAVTPAKVIVVAKEGGDYKTVQDAINAIPDNSTKRHVIFVKNGEYREKLTVPKEKKNVSIVGESKEGTILVYQDNANTPGPDGNPLGTSKSSSMFIYGNDFIAKNITIQNDSGQGTGQAVAAYVQGDRAYFENVRFLGYQDTLYTHQSRQYYKGCYIEGDVDFIFGPATAVFEDCQIHSKRDNSMLTAASTPQDSEFGYVFLNSKITSDDGTEGVRFGRPWRPYSAVSFINTEMDSSIAPDGWDNWGNESNEKTARYSEYNSSGSGANPKARDPWSVQLTPDEANLYTVQNVLKGNDGWDPTRTPIIPETNTSAPIVTIDQTDTLVNKSTFTISGKVNTDATITINEKSVTLQKDKSFTKKLNLEEGANVFTIKATDKNGLIGIKVLNITLDSKAPVVTLEEVKGDKRGNHYNTRFNPLPITGKLNESGKVLVNGKEISVAKDLTFKTDVSLKPGMNTVKIEAVDRAGNKAKSVTFKAVPRGNAVIDGPVQILSSKVTNANTIEVTFNSQLVNFKSSDLELQTATNDWATLNPGLKANLTIERVTTRVNKDRQTVAVIKTKEKLNEDGTITKENKEDPHNIPYLNAPYYTGNKEADIKQADALLSWQMEHGGWYKNMEDKYTRPWDGKEPKSEMYTPDHGELGVIDNNATTNELLFLALMYKETGDNRYKESVIKGVDYLLEAQYETGGWPQVYPARGNYSDYVTYNDNAMVRVMNVLTMISEKRYPFNTDIATDELISDISKSLDSGLDYILKSQIKVDGELTAWCAQHDPTTYEPKEARSYEHPSISGSESVGIVQYLMALPNQTAEVEAAINGALTWFEDAKVEGMKYVSADPAGIYFHQDDSSNTWYRFYEIGTNKPIFSGRDGIIKHNILEIEQERRDGYRWAGEWPQKLLDVAKTTGYYENRIFVKVVGEESKNAVGATLEAGSLYRVEG